MNGLGNNAGESSETDTDLTGGSLTKGNSYVQPSVFDMLAGAAHVQRADIMVLLRAYKPKKAT
jgi:hypothetical protein